jgi:chitinase
MPASCICKSLRPPFALSTRRAVALVVILTAMLSGSASAQTFFSPYKDVTINANWNTGEQQSAVTGTAEAVTSAMPASNSTLTWAFATGTCGSENWGGITPAMEATNAQNFVNAGKYYILSTGGANGTFDCPSNSGMLSFIQTYYSANMLGVDYDIEGGQTQAVIDDLINSTIYAEQQYPSMRFSFTLQSLGAATTGSDLNSLGDTVMSEISRLGLGGNYYIDLMAFDYGSVSSGNCVVSNGVCDMAQSAIAAAESLHSNYGTPYSHIELCLMIGQADAGASETLSLANVDTITAWAKSVGLGGIHFWSFDRDQPSASSSSTSDGTSNPALAYNNEFTSDLGSCTGPGGACGSTPPSQPSFTLSASPGSLSFAQGGSGSTTITVNSLNGFDSAVTLSASGLPSGVTASFSPSSVTPSSDGSATATLTLTANSTAATGSANLTITGAGGGLTETTTTALTVTSTGGSGGSGSVTLGPSSYNFGSAAPGTGTAWVTFTLTNSGSSAVSISSVAVSGPFVVYSNCGSSVAASSSCPIYVYFYPTAAGSFTGTLTVNDNASNSPQTVSLSGTGS